MADTIVTADVIAKIALPILDNELGALSTLHRAHESEFGQTVNGYKKGGSVSINRPADFTVTDGATRSNQDIIEGKVTLSVDQQKHVSFSLTSEQMTLDMENLATRVVKPAVINIVNEVARDTFDQFYKGVYNWAGTPGQVVNSYADFSKAVERLDEMAVMQNDRHAVMSPADYHAMVGSNVSLFVQDAARSALRMAQLGSIGGLNTWMTQVTPTHTNGTPDNTTPLVDGAAQNVTYDAAKNTYSQTLVTDGWDPEGATLTAGTVFTIAGVNMVNPKTKADTGILQQFVVTADTVTNAAAANDTNIVISPPIITSGPHQTVSAVPADDAVIVLAGAASTGYKQNLAYHRNAMALAVVPLEMPQGNVDAARRTKNGLSLRVVSDYDIDNDLSVWRLDILYGRKLIDPRLATRFSGTA